MTKIFNKMTILWIKAAAIRAVRTIAQVALGMITVGAAVSDINWLSVLSVSVVAGVYSILTSVATKLPETDCSDGTLQIDTSNPAQDSYLMNFDTPLNDIKNKKTVSLKVDPFATLPKQSTTSRK